MQEGPLEANGSSPNTSESFALNRYLSTSGLDTFSKSDCTDTESNENLSEGSLCNVMEGLESSLLTWKVGSSAGTGETPSGG